MSSLQSLIEGGGDCGAANPVVELARQFTQSTSSSAVAEDPTTSLLRDIHHPETLVGQQQSQGHQQQQPIGASFSAAAAAQHLLNSSRSSVQQLEQQHQQNSNSTPFDMNLLLEQMREMDSAMERAMKRGHDQQDQQDHHHHLGDLGEVLGDELAGGGGKLSGSTDPFLGSASLEDGGGGWEEALKLNDEETSSSSSAAVDFGGFGGHPPSSSSLIDESWEEALLATVGTPDVLLSAEETGAGNNWVDEYFRTLDAQVDRQEEAEEAAHQAERQSYRGRSIAATTEDGRQQELKNVTGGGPGFFDDFSAFFQSMSSTIDRVASSRVPSSSSTSSQLPQGVRAEVTFNLSELVSDQEERLMNMLLSGGGGALLEEEEEDIVTSTKQFHPDELLNLDAIGRKEEETESQKASSSSSDFKMPSSLLNSTTSPQESQRQQQQQSQPQPQPQKPEEKFFYENQFDDMEFWMKLAEEWEHSSNPLDLEAALNEATATAKQPAVPVVHEPLEELLKPDHLHHYHFVLENPFLKIEEEEEEEEEEAVQEGSEAMKTEDEDDFEEYIRRGLAKLEVGDIPAAILLFEAAAATAPSSARAWLLLGTAQAKNENDRKAIGAMKRCLALDPQNLEALLCLAISFTNESQTAEACAALREWLAAHPKYGHFLAEAEAEAMEEKAKKESENEQQQQQQQQQQYMGPTPLWKRWGAGTSATANSSANIFESGLFERIKGVFIRAATETTAETMDTAEDQQGAAGEQRLPDADVQCGLGVLFSLSGDYEKAADCFRTAVAVRPQEHTLWNRLGATLANGGHSAQAMAAYREALVRYPGYIRARHNLAIACLMLGAEREAVGHLLAVLNLQTAGSRSAAEGGEAAAKSSALAEIIANPSSITSAAVWSLLRTALLALHREDLFPAVGDRNLPLLNREFSFGEEEQEKSSAED